MVQGFRGQVGTWALCRVLGRSIMRIYAELWSLFFLGFRFGSRF